MVLKKNWVLILIVFIAFSGSLANYISRVPQRHYCDFRVYYKAGQDLIKGKNIYIRDREDVTPYKYSPFFALVFVPLSLFPIKISAAVFFSINFVLTILFFKLSFNLLQNSGIGTPVSQRDRSLIYGLTLLFTFRYICLVWYSGQVNILMCVLVLLALRSLSKDKTAFSGAFFASSILIKYTPAIFLPYLLVQKKFKAVFWTIFFIGLFLLLPMVVVGLHRDISYLFSWIPSIIATSLDKFSYIDFKNQSIFSMLIRYLSPTRFNVQVASLSFDQAFLLGHIAALLMFLVILVPGRDKSRDTAINSALLMICLALFNPNSWMINFVSLIPAYMLLIQYTVVGRAKDKFVLLALIAAFISTNLMSRDIFGKLSENFGCYYSFTTFGALLLYTVLLKLKFSRETK